MDERFVDKHKEVLKNRLYGLLCEREKDGSWEDFLDNILLDLNNFNEEDRSYEFYVLYYKIASCRYITYMALCLTIISDLVVENLLYKDYIFLRTEDDKNEKQQTFY